MTRSAVMTKPLPTTLPYYRAIDENLQRALEAYYEKGVSPEPVLLAILQKEKLPQVPNPYSKDPIFIHRWVQQWMPKKAWGSPGKVEKWCNSKEDT